MSNNEEGENTWAGIPGVQPHPDGPARGGKKPQGIKGGGIDQAGEDFDGATSGPVIDLPGGGRQGTGPNGENIILQPGSRGGLDNPGAGPPSIYVDGGAIRYP